MTGNNGNDGKNVGTWRLAATRAGRVVEAFMYRARRSGKTWKTYHSALVALANFMGGDGRAGVSEKDIEKRIAGAVDRILRMKPGTANSLAIQYELAMRAGGLKPATIRQRLTAVSGLIKSAAKIGEIDWTIEIELPPNKPYRDTEGPGRDGVMGMIAAARATTWSVKGARDAAIMWLMFGLGLRKAEVLDLTIANVDVRRSRIAVTAKGADGAQERLDLPPETRDALQLWISMRGLHAGPLMTSLRNGSDVDSPLSESGIAWIITALGAAAGVGKVSPHGIRHAAITEAVIRCGGDILAVRDFARHRDVNTTIRYLDRTRNRRAEVGVMVASGVSKTLSEAVSEYK